MRKTLLITITLIIMSLLVSCIDNSEYIKFVNCTVYTMDSTAPLAETVVFSNGKIVYAGDAAGADKYRSARAIDLAGSIVLPGLIDAHAHMNSLGRSIEELNLRGIRSKAEILKIVLDKLPDTEPGEWISGRGWDQNLWEGKEFPHWRDLQGTEANPVFLKRVDGHAVWANKTVIDICAIDRNTPDPEGGKIIRDAAGNPTGVFLDNAAGLISAKIPKPSDDIRKKRMLRAMQKCSQNGLTGVGDAWVTQKNIDTYRELIGEDKMTVRVYGMLADSSHLREAYYQSGPVLGEGDGMLTIRSIKLFADGALGSRGGLLFEPYSDDPSTCGIEVTGEEEIYEAAKAALSAGFQVCTHAIGDQGNHQVLNAYERALSEVPVKKHRLRVEHCQILLPSDLPRFREFGFIASMQPTHATSDMPWAEDRVGPERIKGAYAWMNMLSTGAVLAFGSDFPVEEVNPLLGIYSAVTRKDLSGNPADGWYPGQCLTIEEAVSAFTAGAAYAQFQENEIGMIKAGMRADFTVLDRDIFQIHPSEIPETRVSKTIVGGKIVYDRNSGQ